MTCIDALALKATASFLCSNQIRSTSLALTPEPHAADITLCLDASRLLWQPFFIAFQFFPIDPTAHHVEDAQLLDSWSLSLMSWTSFAIIALAAWWWVMPQPAPDGQHKVSKGHARALLGQPLAWQVMLLMGSQSSLAYIVFGWLPTLLVRQGYSEHEAGWLMAASILVQLISAIAAPWLARMGKDQRPAFIAILSLVGIGLWVLLLGPASLSWPGAILLGLGQGGSFSLALTLIVLRSGNAKIAGELSALVQGGGYTLAAMGPLIVGLMIDADISIQGITWLLLTILAFAASMALLAGRQLRLEINDKGILVTIDQRRGLE